MRKFLAPLKCGLLAMRTKHVGALDTIVHSHDITAVLQVGTAII